MNSKRNAARRLAYLEKFGKDDKATCNSSHSTYHHHWNSPANVTAQATF